MQHDQKSGERVQSLWIGYGILIFFQLRSSQASRGRSTFNDSDSESFWKFVHPPIASESAVLELQVEYYRDHEMSVLQLNSLTHS